MNDKTAKSKEQRAGYESEIPNLCRTTFQRFRTYSSEMISQQKYFFLLVKVKEFHQCGTERQGIQKLDF